MTKELDEGDTPRLTAKNEEKRCGELASNNLSELKLRM